LHLCSPQTRKRKEVESGKRSFRKLKKIKFGIKKKVSTFAVPKRGDENSRKEGKK